MSGGPFGHATAMGIVLLVIVAVIAIALLLALVKLVVGLVFIAAAAVIGLIAWRRLRSWWDREIDTRDPEALGRSATPSEPAVHAADGHDRNPA